MNKFEVAGEPQGKARHRTTKAGHTYTPEKTKDYEKLVKFSFIQENKNHEILLDALEVKIIAFYKIPKNTKKTDEIKMVYGEIRPTKKPDVDNIAKAIIDALNGIAYKDDSQVVELSVSKYYGREPKVIVFIKKSQTIFKNNTEGLGHF